MIDTWIFWLIDKNPKWENSHFKLRTLLLLFFFYLKPCSSPLVSSFYRAKTQMFLLSHLFFNKKLFLSFCLFPPPDHAFLTNTWVCFFFPISHKPKMKKEITIERCRDCEEEEEMHLFFPGGVENSIPTQPMKMRDFKREFSSHESSQIL